MEHKLTKTQLATSRAVGLFGTQMALAQAIGVTQSTISRWLSGDSVPTCEPLLKLEMKSDRKIRVQDFFE